MSPTHQTSEELLLRYAAGRLPPAPALVVASHLAVSPSSRAVLHAFDALGGALIEQAPLAAVSPGLFERTLAGIERPAPAGEPVRGRNHEHPATGISLPAPLARRNIGRWTWIGPGIRLARVAMQEDRDHNLVLLRVGAGRAMPRHSHSGEELTLVLKGSFHDEAGRHGTGDLIEEGEDTDHRPIIGDESECICLVSFEGPLRIRNWLARLAQPFIGL